MKYDKLPACRPNKPSPSKQQQQAGSLLYTPMNYEYKGFYRRKLPHIHPLGAILFVTFRLAGSVPKTVLEEWKAEKKWLDHELNKVALEVKETQATEALTPTAARTE